MQKMILACGLTTMAVGCADVDITTSNLSSDSEDHPAFVAKTELNNAYHVDRDLALESICGNNDMQ